MAGLGEAIDERRDAGRAPEDAALVFERQVGDDDGGAQLMAAADDVVEDVAAARVRGHIPQLVDQQQRRSRGRR